MQKFRDWPLKYKLNIFFFLIFLILAATAIFSFYIIKINQIDYDVLTKSKLPALENLQKVEIERGIIYGEILEHLFLGEASAQKEYAKSREKINQAVDLYLKAEEYDIEKDILGSSSHERQFSDKFLKYKNVFLGEADRLITYNPKVKNNFYNLASLKFLNRYSGQLQEQIRQEIIHDQFDLKEHQHRISQRMRWSYLIVFVLLVLLSVVFLIMDLVIKKYVREPLKLLYEGAQQMAKGNFKYRLDCQAKDEIGQLCNINNQAAKDLDRLYSKLEREVKKRTKELEEALGREIKREKEISRLKDEFVFIATHELRSPVTAISWVLEEMAEHEKTCEHGEMTMEWIKSLEINVDRLKKLVNDLLDVARLGYGTKKIEKQKVDLVKLIKENINTVYAEAKARKIKIKSEIKEGVPKNINSDPNRLSEILNNLLTNAIKYNHERGTVWLKIDIKKGRLQISVEDTGIGMDKAEMVKLFTKFYRIENKETKEIAGTGLGLFIVKQLVKKMGGKIEVKSEKGKGSIFTVTLPVK